MAEPKGKAEAKFPIGYTVDEIEPWTMLNARGNPIPGFRVSFSFGPGVSDFVLISEKQYNAESVKLAIEERITTHAGVLTLG